MPQDEKTYNVPLKCAPNASSYQPVSPRILIRFFVTLHHWLFKMRPVKILIRLRECAVWSESSLGAHVCSYVFWLWRISFQFARFLWKWEYAMHWSQGFISTPLPTSVSTSFTAVVLATRTTSKQSRLVEICVWRRIQYEYITFRIYSKYWDTSADYHTYPKIWISPFDCLQMCLTNLDEWQTVKILIRRRIMRRLFWIFTVCPGPVSAY